MKFAELWVLADKMVIPVLQNLFMSKIREVREVCGGVAVMTLHYIQETTVVDSLPHQFMVSEVACLPILHEVRDFHKPHRVSFQTPHGPGKIQDSF
jgi:hypothetical protein